MRTRLRKALTKASRIIFRPHYANFLETQEGTVRRYVYNVIQYTDHTCNDINVVSAHYDEQSAIDEVKRNPAYWYQRTIISDAQPEEYTPRLIELSLAPPPLKPRE